MSKINFVLINQQALNASERVALNWVPDGSRKGDEWVGLNPTRSDNSKGSFSINLNSGVWKDFSSNDGGADLISLVAFVEGVTQGKAAASLSKFLGIIEQHTSVNLPKPTAKKGSSFKPITPPLNENINCPLTHPKLGVPSVYWDYLSTDNILLMRVMRFDNNKDGHRKKEFRPLVYGSLNNTKPKWLWRQLPDNRPLYRLNKLTPATHNTTVICEGEKAADAAVNLFPDYFVTCWSGGSKAVSKTNFSLLKDQNIIFWPDNDKAGIETIQVINTELSKIGIKSLSIVSCRFFNEFKPGKDGSYLTGGNWPEKSDAYDAVSMGWNAEHLRKALNDNVLFDKDNIQQTADEDIIPYGYKLDEAGIWHYDPKKEDYRKLCSPIEIVSLSRSGNGDGRNWGRLVKFKDFDHQEKLWNIPMQSFATEAGAEIIRGLLDRGLNISSYREAKRKILEYLQEYETNKRVALVYKTGWYKNSFVFPDSVIGGTEKAMYYSENPSMCKLSEKGTLEEWKNNVSFYCKNNPLALFSISAALSAPLVELMGYESMGFHFYGDSSWGKSTLLNVACSVYGDPEKYKCTFRTTDNALESLAASHSDMLLALDEINQVDSRIIGDIIYMLGNGQGKHRANDRGQAKESQHRWKLTYLTNGEKTLEQYLSEAGKKMTGGMEMRFLGIQATFHEDESERKHKGVFNFCHEFAGGAELSNQLKRNMQKYHGTPFPSFIELLVKQDIKALTTWLHLEVDKFIDKSIASDAGGQVQRAAAKFALVGLAGELATKWGITGWEQGESINAARECLDSWLKKRGGQGNMENDQLINDLKLQLELYGDSKFKRWDKTTKTVSSVESTIIDTHVPSPSEMWGFRRHQDIKNCLDGDTQEVIYYIYPNAFEKIICKGNDHLRIARLLRDKGALLLRDSELKENRLKTKERLPGTGKTMRPIYKIKSSILFSEH